VVSGSNFDGGGWLETPTRVLVVDDYEPWRRFVRSRLAKRPQLQIVGEVADGLEAVHKAQELQPDLILLDIDLPTLNGIEAARRIRERSRKSKILFASVEQSPEIVREAFDTGAMAYVCKADAVIDLLPAVDMVLQGKQFVSASRKSHDMAVRTDSQAADHRNEVRASAALPLPQRTESRPCHEVGFYSDDPSLLDHLAQLVGDACKAGNAVIVIASKSRRDSLLRQLRAHDAEIGTAIDRGGCIALDAAEMLSAFMRKGMPDLARFLKLLGNLIETTAEAQKERPVRVTIFGEWGPLLCAEGNPKAAILVEKFVNQLVKKYDVEIFCMYSLRGLQDRMDSDIFEQIRAEHSAICFP